MKLLDIPHSSTKVPIQQQNKKQGRNHQVLAPFAELMVIVLEKITKTH